MTRVLFIGDSHAMRGGVSTVMKTLKSSSLWEQYNCAWLETQINKGFILKILYLLMGCIKGLYIIPRYKICHFQTTPGSGMVTLFPIFVYTLIWRRKIIVQLHMGNQIRQHTRDWTFRFWAKHSDCFVFLGKTWVDEIKPYLPKSLRIEYLYNPVSIKHEIIDNCERYSCKYFLYAAYFNDNKGYDVLLKAYSQLVNDYADWKLVMCGAGETTSVVALVDELHLSDRVVIPGWVVGAEKENWFRQATAFCMTSYQEGLPMSILEAMSMKVPVISTPVGCLPEFLKDGENVLFFDFGDVDGLHKCMRKIIENVNLADSLAKNAFNVVLTNFETENVVKKLLSIYAQVV